jgi:hypothetical protein
MAIEADRWDIADLAPEPPFDAAGDGLLAMMTRCLAYPAWRAPRLT